MVKKAQAAMEFLMTYGWAILVVLIAIGALAYFGVLSPGKFLPQSCTLAPGFACSDFTVTNTLDANGADVVVAVRNGAGSQATSVTFTVTPQGGSACVAAPTGYTAPTTIAEGADATFKFDCGAAGANYNEGDRFKAALTMVYTFSGQSLSHTVTGDMTTRVE